MRIHRDYSRPFFSNRRHGPNITIIFLLGIMIGGILVVTTTQFDRLQLEALEVVGMAPTLPPPANQVAAQGLAMMESGDMEQAVTLLGQAMRQQPNDVNYLYEYAIALLESDQTSASIPIGEQMIQLAPNDPRGYEIKGRALMFSNPTEAILASIQGVDVAPNYAPLLAIQGVAYTQLGRWQEGNRLGAQAVELAPDNAFVQRAFQHPLVYIGRFQDAIRALETSIAIQPGLLGAYFELAFLYKHPQVREPEMAIAIYNTIIQRDPENAKAYLRLCEAYAGVDNARFDVAQPYCDQAIRVDPTYASAYRQRGQMQYNRRNYEGAIQSFEECVRLGSDEIECWYLRGYAHFLLNNCQDAWNILTEARDMGVRKDLPADFGPMETISIGLYNVTVYCPEYRNVATPTPIPPTPVPATPIGGFG